MKTSNSDREEIDFIIGANYTAVAYKNIPNAYIKFNRQTSVDLFLHSHLIS